MAAPRRVHWAIDAEAFSAANSPAGSSSSSQESAHSVESHEQHPSAQTPPRPTRYPLPPTPHPNTDVPLPTINAAAASPPTATASAVVPPPPLPMSTHPALHPALTPAAALQAPLDLSLPSAALHALPHELLHAPACNPPEKCLVVRISTFDATPASFKYKARVQVGAANGACVTVGEVLTKIHTTLRTQDAGLSSQAHAQAQGPPSPTTSTSTVSSASSGSGSRSRTTPSPSAAAFAFVSEQDLAWRNSYRDRRIQTLNSPPADPGYYEQEWSVGARFIDRFLGHTMFAGLTPLPSGRVDFQLQMVVPSRYSTA
ncbi:hypothetical protein HMN09_01177300 [Mycena chlorophos]|uniref:Uncharacterized protein n=1 Tax=Mycena chlorophos TaxID=658473 RepID=A0A8H6S9J7_MYCCL|nr:hypothetical protein HMN09_01177300 [Mycena chlorophos]